MCTECVVGVYWRKVYWSVYCMWSGRVLEDVEQELYCQCILENCELNAWSMC